MVTVIAKAMKEFTGKGPLKTKVYFMEDTLLIRMQGVLNLGDLLMAKTENGCIEVKHYRLKRATILKDEFVSRIGSLLQRNPQNFFYDIDPGNDESVIIFTF